MKQKKLRVARTVAVTRVQYGQVIVSRESPSYEIKSVPDNGELLFFRKG